MAIYTETFASFEELRANPDFRRRGITAAGAYNFLMKWCPEFIDEYEAYHDERDIPDKYEPTLSEIRGRMCNMFTNNCREHPRIHPKLKDLFAEVLAEYLAKTQDR